MGGLFGGRGVILGFWYKKRNERTGDCMMSKKRGKRGKNSTAKTSRTPTNVKG